MPQDPYRYFRVEAGEILEQLGRDALELERSADGSNLVARMLRLAHTLKGAARVVKQPAIADLAHAVEDALAPLRDGGVTASRRHVDEVLALIDRMATPLAALGKPPEAAHGGPVTPAEEPLRIVRADVEEVDALLDGIAETSVRLGRIRRSSTTLERARVLAARLAASLVVTGSRSLSEAQVLGMRGLADDLRLLLDELEPEIKDGFEQVESELRQVREAGERLRLVPASVMLAVLERTARDVGQSLDKVVDFVGIGGDVRLDGQVLGVIQQALLQAVRNAIAHGIEPATGRAAAGKPPRGRVTIEIVRRTNRVVFRCSDDGRGVDLDAVRRAAERKGVAAAELRTLGAEQLIRLLLGGGITTSGTLSQAAGRGIGLDVVRDAAQRLGGAVEIRTQAERGTTVELTVPVSLSSLEALVVEAAGKAMAIPLDSVRRTVRLAPSEIAHGAGGATVLFEGRVVPFAPLSRMMGETDGAKVAGRPWTAVIIEGDAQLAAVGVDRLRGTQNLVLQALPAATPGAATVAGVALDIDGDPRVVLDSGGLSAAVRGEAGIDPSECEQLPVLVVDDSLTTRMLEQSILESAGYRVDVAVSGEDGLEKARSRRYALFLVDVEMPGMDGFAFIERIRADPGLHDIPAILVTSRASPEDRRRGEQVGANGHVLKSEFDQTDLLARIRVLVGEQ